MPGPITLGTAGCGGPIPVGGTLAGSGTVGNSLESPGTTITIGRTRPGTTARPARPAIATAIVTATRTATPTIGPLRSFGATLAQLGLALRLCRLAHLSLSHLYPQALQNLGDVNISGRDPQTVLHGHRAPSLLLANQVHHGALSSGPTSTTGAMDVVLDVLRRIQMQHQIHPLHVQSTGHQIGSHQHLHFTIGPRP